jgi:uncharacterized membrane protein YeiH
MIAHELWVGRPSGCNASRGWPALVSATRVPFEFFPYFDWAATLLWAMSGAMLAARRGFDLMGVFIVALVSATGGGLLRDGLFLQNGPPALLRTPTYLQLVGAAVVIVAVFGSILRKLRGLDVLLAVADALGLGAYAVVGMNLARGAGLPPAAMIVVGMANAVGGGVLRDVLTGDPPQILRPGLWLHTAALCGCVLFVLMMARGADPSVAGLATVGLVFTVRLAAIRFGIKSRPLPAFRDDWRVDDGR